MVVDHLRTLSFKTSQKSLRVLIYLIETRQGEIFGDPREVKQRRPQPLLKVCVTAREAMNPAPPVTKLS
jgi:hypothetical protein